ncbi:MAG: type I 3-dehydroquinate dehydratase [Eubacterium sp.]|nr:type I 3-dehydroquinate dehydratase [Eubacterium sp.]
MKGNDNIREAICVPIVSLVWFGILAEARQIAAAKVDMAEWRLDFFAGQPEEIPAVIRELKEILGDKKLIVTLRSTDEGGEENGERFDYFETIRGVIEQGMADYVDIELEKDEDKLREMIVLAQNSYTKIIGSYHDFEAMPEEDFIFKKLEKAHDEGCDMGKIACMAETIDDAGRMLVSTGRFHSEFPSFPVATMAMGRPGYLTRLYGGLYGSCLTFATIGKASAPGQRSVEEVTATFDKLFSHPGHIILIGFMGTGKTTISKALSEAYGIPEVDTDSMIVQKTGKQISEIFDEDGESAFRQVETDILDELGTLPRSVVSCGGGTVLRDINVRKLKNFGTIVRLTAKPETVYKRIHKDNSRPLLDGNMNVGYIAELMEKRNDAYERAADLSIKTDDREVDAIAADIWDHVK